MSAPGNLRRTSERDEWQTPDYIVDAIAHDILRIDRFAIDPCAGANSVISRHGLNLHGPCFGPETTNCCCGLHGEWRVPSWPYEAPQYAFVNPPYSQAAEWVDACWSHEQIEDGCPSLLLLPNSTDTAWWHEANRMSQQTIHVEGRISFYHPGHTGPSANTGGSTLFIFDRSLPVMGSGTWKRPSAPKGWAPPVSVMQPVVMTACEPRLPLDTVQKILAATA